MKKELSDGVYYRRRSWMRRVLCGGLARRSSTASLAAAFFHSPPFYTPIRASFFASSCEAAVIGLAQTAVSEMEWPANKVRDTFIKFFESKNHVEWKSSPVVPLNDPTLLFANAGLVPSRCFHFFANRTPQKIVCCTFLSHDSEEWWKSDHN